MINNEKHYFFRFRAFRVFVSFVAGHTGVIDA